MWAEELSVLKCEIHELQMDLIQESGYELNNA